MRGGPRNIVASIQARLVQRSHELDVEHQLTLARFGGERLLYRLSKSEFGDRFILKGAALLLVRLGETIRPTKDVDLLGFGDTSAEALKRVFVVNGFKSPGRTWKRPRGLTQWPLWLRGGDLNPRPLGYEPNELPDCSTPRHADAPTHPTP